MSNQTDKPQIVYTSKKKKTDGGGKVVECDWQGAMVGLTWKMGSPRSYHDDKWRGLPP